MNESNSNARSEPKWVKPLVLLLLAVGLVSMGLVIAAAVKGEGAFALAGKLWVKPTRYLRFAIAGLAGAWLLQSWARGVLGRTVAKLVMLSISVALSVAVLEIGMRAILKKQMDAGSFDRFKEMKARGEKIKVRSASSLAAIITPSENPRVVYELQPNLEMEFGHCSLRISSQGFRSDLTFSKERKPNSIRILGLGDSGMFGWGVNQGSNYLDVATRILNGRGDGVTYEALNTGTPGYNTQMEVELLKDRGLDYKPDIVVVGWCENDFGLSHFFLKETPLPKDHLVLYDYVFDRERYRALLGGPEITDRAGVTDKKTGALKLDEVPDMLEAGTGESGVRAAMAELKALGAKHGFKILVFGPMRKPTPKAPNDIEKILKELGLEYVDTFAKVDASKYPENFYVHAMHPRDGGHRVLGELLVKELDARGGLKPAN
jgi:hypothetical protein